MMNWLQNLFVKMAAPVLKFAPRFLRHTFSSFTFWRGVEGYQQNSAVFACVSALAFSFPEPPLLAGTEKDGKFTANYDDPIMKLIQQPNPDMGEAEFAQYCVVYAAIGGNVYLWKQRNQNGGVLHLWPFSDGQITPIPGEDTSQGLVKHYEYDAGNGVKIPIPKEDIIQWKWMPDPLHPEKGMGGIMAAAREVDKDTEATAYIYSLLKNNAVPPIVITLVEGEELTDDKAKRLRKEWKTSHSGENAGTPAFLEAGMTIQKLGFDLQQLAGEALSGVPEARIAACLRVPPVVAGLSVGLKRSDYGDQAARRAFTELTLSSLWRMFASELQNGLRNEIPAKPANWRLQHNLRVVRALQDDETKVWERVTSAFERSMLTRAEAKNQLGIEPKPGDDVYKVSLASEFVPVGQEVVRDVPKSRGLEVKAQPRSVAAGLRKLRGKIAGKMETSLQGYFADLADKVVARAKGKKAAPHQLPPNAGERIQGERKSDLPSADDLLTGDDSAALTGLIKRYYVTILEASWATWNTELGVEKAFDLTDPLVTEILGSAGLQVRDIEETTLKALRDLLQYAGENGWGIEDLIRGDPENGIKGLRDVVAETYKDRARTIARTELGNAQNEAAARRYGAAGVTKVEIMDNGLEDDDEDCRLANGQIWSLSYFMAHTLQHPNCTRASAAYFGDATPDKE